MICKISFIPNTIDSLIQFSNKNMIYLICQDWSNTSNNHAGIKYLCNTLGKKYPNKFKSIVIPAFWDDTKSSKNRIVQKLQKIIVRYRHRLYVNGIVKKDLHSLSTDDKVILMEYMELFYPMLWFVKTLKQKFPSLAIEVMVHLVPAKLTKSFPKPHTFNAWIDPVDKIYTLGHSLSDYLVSRGTDANKIVTTFHYVDDYYYNERPVRNNTKIQVIAMGNQMRNVKLLKAIVEANPNVNFTICQGVSDMREYFGSHKNVELIPFVEENVLRQYMQRADISLNAMEDTIGSNVIVTSLAMGLAMLCSDVGSIRDYCDEDNCIFCNSVEDFSRALDYLNKDRDRLSCMQTSAYKKSLSLSIDHFAESINF